MAVIINVDWNWDMQYKNKNTLLFSMVPSVPLAKNKINEIKSQYFRKEKV